MIRGNVLLPAPRSLRRRILSATFVLISVLAWGQDVSAPELYRAGARALAMDDVYDAIALFRDALAVNPSYLEPTLGLSQSYFRLAEYDQAMVHADRALVLAQDNTDVGVLRARILLAMGDLQQAESVFRDLLRAEPNNLDARLGLAELAAARGRNGEAATELLRAQRLSSQDQRTLLSLVLVYDELGDPATAQRYLELALESHQSRPEVQVLAAEHYLRAGDLDQALYHARVALSLDQTNRPAARLFAEASLTNGEFREALSMSEQLIVANRNDSLAWYIRGLTLYNLDRLDEALTAFRTALRLTEPDEITRLVLEELVINRLDLEDSRRQPLAAYHAESARGLTDEHRYGLAIDRYRQALRLDPYSTDTRRSYAELHRSMGNLASYLQELLVARDLGADDRSLRNRIDVYQGVLRSSVSHRWDVDQFALARSRTPVWIASSPGTSAVLHPLSVPHLMSAAARSIQSHERVEIVGQSVDDRFATIFENAREAGCDYLLWMRFGETERSFSIAGTVYLARTGTEVFSAHIERTGVDRVRRAIQRFAERFSSVLPLRGRILARDGDRILVDIGRRDGLAANAELVVLDQGAVVLNPDNTGITYAESRTLAPATVTALDDLVSEATLELGIVDRVSVGDTIIAPGEQVVATTSSTAFPVLYHRLRALQAR